MKEQQNPDRGGTQPVSRGRELSQPSPARRTCDRAGSAAHGSHAGGAAPAGVPHADHRGRRDPPGQSAAVGGEPSGEHLYVVGTGKDSRVKIGRTRRTKRERLRELQTGNPDTLQILRWFDGLAHMEAPLHEYYARYRISGEWFDFRDHDPVQQVELALVYLQGIEPVLAAREAEWRARLDEVTQDWSEQVQALRQQLADLEMLFATERAFAALRSHAREKAFELACDGVPRWVIGRFVVGSTVDEINAGAERARKFVADLARGYGDRAA